LDKLDEEPLNEEIFEMRQRIGRVGTFKFLVTFMNDSYVGFDKECKLEFTIKADDPDRETQEYQDEDLAAIKGPGIVQDMLGAEAEDESDSDDDLSELERLQKRLKEANLAEALERDPNNQMMN